MKNTKGTLTVLSHDPGTRNSAWAIVQLRSVAGQISVRILANGMVSTTVTQVKSGNQLQAELKAYQKFLESKAVDFDVDIFAAERYMPRGIGGNTIELVNMGLGAFVCSTNLPVKLVGSATWKNGIKRAGIDLKAAYKEVLTTPHQLDAVLIGVYMGCFAYKQKDFGTFDIKKNWEGLLRRVESTSITALRNKRKA